VQGWLFDPNRLAPTYTEAQITRPFPFNAFYGIDDAPVVDGSDFRLKVSGLVQNTKTWTLPELYALPKAEQITRHICVEGWSAIGRWGGTPFSEFLKRVGRGHIGEICRFQVRGRLLRKHRYADRLAFADAADVHL
jgi:DMSO/TMAO reductase YedYZ molybdopterin-dependent catalytic subunit